MFSPVNFPQAVGSGVLQATRTIPGLCRAPTPGRVNAPILAFGEPFSALTSRLQRLSTVLNRHLQVPSLLRLLNRIVVYAHCSATSKSFDSPRIRPDGPSSAINRLAGGPSRVALRPSGAGHAASIARPSSATPQDVAIFSSLDC